VVRSPIHLTDGELTTATNAQFDQTGAEGGIRKRDGMAKVNTAALGGGSSISNILPVPLTDFSELTKGVIFVENDAGLSYWTVLPSTLTDIIATVTVDWPAARLSADIPAGAFAGYCSRFATWSDRFFYVGRTGILYSARGAYTGDGSFEKLHTIVAPDGYTGATMIHDLLIANGRLYFTTNDGQSGGNYGGRVFQMDLATAAVAQVGGQFGAGLIPLTLCWWNGYLWLGTTNALGTATARVYRINPNTETAWALVYTAPANNSTCTGMVGYRGNLYATFCGLAATTAAIVVQLTPALASSVVDTAAGVGGYYGQPIVYANILYCPWGGVVGTASLVRSYNGTIWGTAFTDPTYTGAFPGCPLSVPRFSRLVIPWLVTADACVLFTGAAWSLLVSSALTDKTEGPCAYVEG